MSQKRNILLAEDQQSSRFVLSFQLKKAGYEVFAVENGAQAYKKIKELIDSETPIDLLVTDIEMPEMSGLELYTRLLAEKIEIPVVVMTAYGSKNIVLDLMRMGCSEYLDKPFEPSDLIDRVDKIFAEIDEKKIETENLLLNKSQLEHELSTYKKSNEELREQVSKAKVEYQNLTSIDKESLKVNLCYRNEPLADLGGDFFSIKNTKNGCDVILADVAGHDMGSSFHTLLIKNVFDENIKNQLDGENFFKLLNSKLLEDGKNERMVTAVFIRINLLNNKAHFTSAGHPFPIFQDNFDEITMPIQAEGDILGILNDVEFTTISVDIFPKNRIFIYTDGVDDLGFFDKKNINFVKVKNVGIRTFLDKYKVNDIEKFLEIFWDDLKKFSKSQKKDDTTFVAIEIK